MKLKHLFIALCGIFMVSLLSCKTGDVTMEYAQLPEAVKAFVGKHFAGQQVRLVKADTDEAITEYDVYFADGTKVEIDSVGNWSEVSNTTVAVPVTMLPDTTQTYIAANYPNAKVVKVEKDRKGYDVKLANGTELEFDQQGIFYKIDR